jgi:hypothetical protein
MDTPFVYLARLIGNKYYPPVAEPESPLSTAPAQ